MRSLLGRGSLLGTVLLLASCHHDLDQVAVPCSIAEGCGPGKACIEGRCTAVAAGTAYADLTWKAKVPATTALKFHLRSGVDPKALETATWCGPTSTTDAYTSSPAAVNAAHKGHRYIQYRATLASDYGDTPVLDRVAVSYK